MIYYLYLVFDFFFLYRLLFPFFRTIFIRNMNVVIIISVCVWGVGLMGKILLLSYEDYRT